MLTDYHLHLRPDDPGTPPDEFFTEENVDRYLEAARTAGIEELGVAEHIHRFSQALEIWDHPWWVDQAKDDVDAYCEFVRSTPLRLGIEADWVAGRAEGIKAFLGARDWDFVVGSVHFIGDNAVDHAGWDFWDDADPEEIWRRYFETLADAARSGLYDILAHPDLVKVWGKGKPFPEGDLARFYEPCLLY
jgi:histidinol-phosphatase (PHP family)